MRVYQPWNCQQPSTVNPAFSFPLKPSCASLDYNAFLNGEVSLLHKAEVSAIKDLQVFEGYPTFKA
jgi:hypothetical protein